MSEEGLADVVDVLVRVTEAGAAAVIFVGAVLAFGRFLVVAVRGRGRADFTFPRLELGRYLSLGLELQLASDILSTAIAPTFEEIGKLAAVAAIRTALNFFLAREIKEERAEVEEEEERRRRSA